MSNTTLFLIAIVVIMLAAIPIAMMLKDFLPNLMEKSSGMDQLENKIYVLHSEVHELQDRVNHLTQRRNSQASEKSRLESDIRKAEKLIKELSDLPPMFVHEVGDPQAGLMKFVATLSHAKASAEARASGEKVQVNPIWRCANVAEVWATGFEDAKQMLEVAFPFKMGFEKEFLRSGGKGMVPKKPSMSARMGAGS
ncbi:hypothetical protein [Azospirillum griseum]|uniref:Uncharacterized protein n=1 Tax=Azospirillum griseum TaxID=2496639 RepID=A0A3S0K7D8_9PROT|nr:hypothetical protein [Azospirillum griseum]RTR23634.1 hypothetical protein EJ903_03645 [Azospirillum griseum]